MLLAETFANRIKMEKSDQDDQGIRMKSEQQKSWINDHFVLQTPENQVIKNDFDSLKQCFYIVSCPGGGATVWARD